VRPIYVLPGSYLTRKPLQENSTSADVVWGRNIDVRKPLTLSKGDTS
jgi:hypothetical protein